MIPGCYSRLWLHCRRPHWLCFAETWRERDAFDPPPDGAPAHLAEALEMGAWLRLPERERNAIVATYAGRTPPSMRVATDRWRRVLLEPT